MDMSKCAVIVITTEENATPQNMNPRVLHILFRARESHLKYRSTVRLAALQLFVAAFFLFFRHSSADTVCLGVLGGTVVSAATAGLGAWAWKKRFLNASSE